MSLKQDRTAVRTAAQLEQKLGVPKTFREVLGLIDDTRDRVDSVQSSLTNELNTQITSMSRSTTEIIMSALETYVKKEDQEELNKKISAELDIMAGQISAKIEETVTQIEKVDGELQTTVNTIKKHFDFTVDGLIIKAGEEAMQLQLDNGIIRFKKNGEEFGWWDGVNFHTGNIVIDVNEKAQYGHFADFPRSDGSLMLLKVGE